MRKTILTILALLFLAAPVFAQDTSPTPTHFRMLDQANSKFTLWPVDSVAKYQAFIDSLAAFRARARADSIRMNDSLAALQLRINAIDTTGLISKIDSSFYWTVLDTFPTPNLSGSGRWIWGVAGDTTSPGLVYKVSSTKNKWLRADTSVSVRGRGLAMDSVAINSVCRFLVFGTFRKSGWTWTPGTALFSDSITAGKIGIGGQATPKKMQFYGTALDSVVILFDPDMTIIY